MGGDKKSIEFTDEELAEFVRIHDECMKANEPFLKELEDSLNVDPAIMQRRFTI